jgi:hypothetical protein
MEGAPHEVYDPSSLKLILSITLCIDRDQINSIGVFLPITPTKFILLQYYDLFSDKINLIGVFLPITLIIFFYQTNSIILLANLFPLVTY